MKVHKGLDFLLSALVILNNLQAMEHDECIVPLEVQCEITKHFFHDHPLKDELKQMCYRIIKDRWSFCTNYSGGNYVMNGSWNKKDIINKSGCSNRVHFFPDGSQRFRICMAYSPDRDYIALSYNGSLFVRSIHGNQRYNLDGHRDPIRCVLYSPDGNHIVTGSEDKKAIIWNTKSRTQEHVLRGHNGSVLCVAYSPDGNHIVTGSKDRSAIVWDAEHGNQAYALCGHTSWVSSVEYSPDGNHIATGSLDKSVIIWDAKSGDQACVLQGPNGCIVCVAYSSDGDRLVAVERARVVIWDIVGRQEIERFFERGFSIKLMLMLDLISQAIRKNKKLFIHKKEMPVFKELPEVAQRILKNYIKTKPSKNCVVM